MKLKQYPKYKESGVPWIGRIPENWEVRKIKNVGFVATSSVDKKIEPDQPMVNLVNYMDVYNNKDKKISNKMSFMQVSAKPEQILSSKLKKGDVLFNPSSEEENDIGHSAVVVDELKNTLHSYHIVRLRFNNTTDLNLEYKRYAFNNHFVLNQASYQCKGTTRAILSLSDIKEFQFILPPVESQIEINTFLDFKLSELDLIKNKDERLIELLKERRKAVINHTLAKGVDPKAKLRDSGIEWIGKIPTDWEIKKLKFLVTKIGSGITPHGGALVYQDQGIPLIRSQNVHFDGLKLDDVAYISEEIYRTMINSGTKKHDVLLNITGASIGRCTCIENEFGKGNVNQHVCIIRVDTKKLFYKFLNYFLMADLGQEQIFSIQMGTSREGLNFEQIGNFRMCLPPKSEQIQIAEYLDKETKKIDQTIEKIERKIELLEEFKKSLIHHVVMGKVDVREAI